MGAITDWMTEGSDGEPIEVSTTRATMTPRAHAVIVHGFLGYKDYGMLPRLGERLAEAGLMAHRINLSHAGVRGDPSTFSRPDLFERDTWRKQAFDIGAVLDAICAGQGPAGDSPRTLEIALIGHSRGGVSCLLAAAERLESGRWPKPARVVTLAAPSTCCSWDQATRRRVLEDGFHEVRSSRTGQTLRVGRSWLQEQLDDPGWHDLPGRIGAIGCPVLVMHGAEDPTVPVSSAGEIAGAIGANAEPVVIAGGDHVFNTPNPLPPGEPESPQLLEVIERTIAFLEPLGR